MNKLGWTLSIAVTMTVGCASAPSKPAKAPTAVKESAPVPTYTEKVGAIGVAELKSSDKCPRDGAWKSVEWKTAVSMANGCVKVKDWRKVEAIGNELAVRAHLTPWGAYYLSLVATERKDFPRALWMLDLALKKAPGEGLFHYQKGRVYWEMKNDTEAIQSLRTAADLNADLTDAHWIMGQIALQQGDNKAAEKYLANALQRNSRHFPALMAMASAKAKVGDWIDAEATLNKAIRVNPRATKARLALAEIQEMQLKRLSAALATYKEIRQLAGARKLDERPGLNLDEKIKGLEQSLSQVNQSKKVSTRKPTSERKVSE